MINLILGDFIKLILRDFINLILFDLKAINLIFLNLKAINLILFVNMEKLYFMQKICHQSKN